MFKKSIISLLFSLWATMAMSQTAPCPEKILCVGETESIDCVPECVVEIFGPGTWSSSNASVATVAAATSHTSIVTGVSSGTATITYTVAVASGTAMFTTAVTVNPLPVAAPSYTFPVCEGGTLYLFANDGGGNTYAWTGPSGYSSTVQNPTRVSATSAMSGVYSLTVTTPFGCIATYIMNVTVSTGSGFTVSVNQTSPFNLTGGNVHTYCTAGFQLQAVTDPTLPGTGVTYTWVTAGSTYSTTTPVFTPTFTPTSTVVTKVYTLTVSYNGCTASTIETIIIPPSSCSPCDYYNVAKNRELSGLPALSGCSDCNVTQPFYTITSSELTDANVEDGKNYYVIKDVWCRKNNLYNNNFFMNTGIYMHVDAENDVDINHCHFFSTNTCWWRGIVVDNPAGGTGTAHLSVHGNTLIENCGGTGQTVSSFYSLFPSAILTTATTFYNSSMVDILNSDGVIYNRNYYGLQLVNYKPSLSSASSTDKLPFTIKNSVFSSVFLGSLDYGTTAISNYPFSWPSAETLKTVINLNVVPTFKLKDYTVSTLTNESQAGIILQNCGSSSLVSAGSSTAPSQYNYNYITIGDPTGGADSIKSNLFHGLNFGLQLIESNLKIYNNKFIESIITSLHAYNGINDLKVIGSRVGHTNNRFYNAKNGLRVTGNNDLVPSASHDFTCTEADFYNAHDFMVGTVNNGLYILHNNGFNNYTVSDNVFYNHSTSAYCQNSNTASLTSVSGTFDFHDNHMTGGSATTSGKIMEYGLLISDSRMQAASNTMSLSENINVNNNYVSGAYYAIFGGSYSSKFYINNNTIDMKFYSSAYTPTRGIRLVSSAHAKEIQHNVISGQAFAANNAHAISIENCGSVSNDFNISCNRVQNVKIGFDFRGTSVLQLTNNVINRCGIGLQINLNASIGTQGSACNPADNKWVNESCSSCTTSFSGWLTSGFTTFMDGGNSNLSPMYTRNDVVNYPEYIPVNNSASTGTAYIWSSSLLNSSILCTGGLSAPTGCETEGARSMVDGSGSVETEIARAVADVMTVYPNPNDGDVTIKLTGNEDKTVNIKVMNAVGVEVYRGQHKIEHDKTDLYLHKFPAGMYTIQVIDSKGENRTSKILKRQ